ncbi:CPBP family intramembrane metalloprotease [Dechloromonas sp. XY25]|uniref:CPBP family intramembrane metalloprotease n=1 Tax=Dechloromonas hankyongensis TaxID=2908002 RepID=A0ABS9K260_9RHOO|nr:CPBP family intramembrane glutamic endopeptidase [Dechloromonas hankyongensis]MCG2577260.1 CPBP family intramembrane metalloprotease [Dechloromonas hankyongensis]
MSCPAFFWWECETLRHWIVPQLVGVASICLWLLWRDPDFDRRCLMALPELWRRHLLRIARIFIPGGAALLGWVAWSDEASLFDLPRQQPHQWLALMLLYPLGSVLAQELIFRVFVFHRYRRLFGADSGMVLASSVSFALAHFVLGNLLAPLLSFFGGLLFSLTYRKTRSFAVVALEHWVWGAWLFSVGLGRYFGGN